MIWTGLIILVMILVLLVPISKPCQILITKKTIHSSKKELFFYAKAKLYDCFTIRENGKSATN